MYITYTAETSSSHATYMYKGPCTCILHIQQKHPPHMLPTCIKDHVQCHVYYIYTAETSSSHATYMYKGSCTCILHIQQKHPPHMLPTCIKDHVHVYYIYSRNILLMLPTCIKDHVHVYYIYSRNILLTCNLHCSETTNHVEVVYVYTSVGSHTLAHSCISAEPMPQPVNA